MCYVLKAIDIPTATYSVVTLPIKPWDDVPTQVLQNDKPICELFVPQPKCSVTLTYET